MMRFLKFTIAFVALNYFSGKTNIKEMVNRTIDVGLTMKHVSQDGSISKEDKEAIVQELQELSDAVITFLDEIELPD